MFNLISEEVAAMRHAMYIARIERKSFSKMRDDLRPRSIKFF
jgi:hypothetical protein